MAHPDSTYVDLTVHFIRANGLPKMDVIGSADPYIVARVDQRISFVSSVKGNTLAPEWNESWKIKNVPDDATLLVEVFDKDSGNVTDDYIGQFTTAVSPGDKEVSIEDPTTKRNRGRFWLKIEASPSEDPNASNCPYTFDGPVYYSQHSSPTIGRFTNLNNARLYSTWKVYIRGVRQLLGDTTQPWNHNHKAARTIFQGPTSYAVRSMIHSGHRMLYARSATNDLGVLVSAADVYSLLHGGHAGKEGTHTAPGPLAHRIKPAVYNYVIAEQDDSLRFSETGAAFFVNFASKHALHADCAPAVRYSGEFHPRPAGGWEGFDDATPDEQVQWEMVVDNKSGTYAPDPKVLPAVAQLFEYNFPGFRAVPLTYDDPELAKSSEACRAYALTRRGISKDELQPHTHGEGQLLAETATNGGDGDSAETQT